MKRVKFILLISVTLLLIIIGSGSCFATNYAYSIGGKFPSGEVHAGDDFSSNVVTAANAYHLLSNTSSYYSNYPSYSYLSGSNGSVYRFGGAKIFFINSHGSADSITMITQSDSNYRIGISYGYNDNAYVIPNSGSTTQYKVVGVLSRSLSGAKLITYCGCDTALGNDVGSTNLTNRSQQRGATSVVGFKGSIISRFYTGPSWLQTYNYAIGNGSNVLSAINQAAAAYPNDLMSSLVSISGSGSTVLGNANPILLSEAIAKDSQIAEIIKPIEEKYNAIDVQNKNYILKNDIKDIVNIDQNGEIVKNIIDEIKNVDENFDANDYKITSNIINLKEGTGHIFLTYFIDGKIETNKVYMAYIENCKLKNVILAGVKKDNIKNIYSSDEKNLIKIVNEFETNKKKEMEKNTDIKSIVKTEEYLDKDNTINSDSLRDDIKLLGEKYFFDYNNNNIEYQLLYTRTFGDLTSDGELIRMKLK